MKLVKYNKTVKKAKRKLRLIRKSRVKAKPQVSKFTIMNRLRRLLRRTPTTTFNGVGFGTFRRVQPFSLRSSIVVTGTFERYQNKFIQDERRFARTERSKIKPKRAARYIRKLSGLAA